MDDHQGGPQLPCCPSHPQIEGGVLYLEVACPDEDGVGVVDVGDCGAIYRRRKKVRRQRIVQSGVNIV